jgi:hypothetical protein
MDEILWAILQLVLEILLEVGGEAILDGLFRLVGKAVVDWEPGASVLAHISYFAVGCVTGGLSVLLVPHPVFRRTQFHGISLLVAPLVTGLVMSMVGSALRKRNRRVLAMESFGVGFAIALGIALVRFLLAK